MISITLFWILKSFTLYGELPQKNSTINHDGVQIGKIEHPQTAKRYNGFEHPHYETY
jgi:hypothetical protein